MADPAVEASTEETLGSGEPAKAKPQSLKRKQKQKHKQPPKQKQPARQRRAKNRRESFAPYFPQVLKCVHMGLSLSQEAVSVLDSFVKDMFERIAQEAGHLARTTQRATLTSREIQTAVRLLLPGDLGKHAVSEGTKAVIRYSHSE
ncbi:late histone H2B.L4-like [Talpa occidentalis]|uniref:late histone H2B.L4-like n=1 Tax=Talpa occidentalis TaxID=50954 RepID=UPI0023F628C1|nr:late histone H2B.L4-like [Talpa occidentalis]